MSKAGKAKASKDNAIEPGHSNSRVDNIPLSKMTTRQLHEYLNDFNWDGGIEKVFRAIRSKQCDLGSALLAFWRSDPRYAYEAKFRGDRESLRFFSQEWRLAREIVERVESRKFKTAACSFNPRNDAGTDWTEGKPANIKIGIPKFMCQAVRRGRKDARIGPASRVGKSGLAAKSKAKDRRNLKKSG